MRIPATDAAPEQCHVTGYVVPQIQFELRLPTSRWSQRYLQLGCGGFCGYMTDPVTKIDREGHLGGCMPENLGNFAVAFGNSGHAGTGGLWAKDAPHARIDWGYRSEHALATASKAIIARYYGAPPTYAYFAGCSNGGRQGLMLAQRFPEDFDGILVGAAPVSFPGVMLAAAWMARANTGTDGSRILSPDTLPILQQGALAACDEIDGFVDGLISDPRACHFDPGRLACPAADQTEACLSPAQVEAARKLYTGPVDEQGRRLYPGGMPVGSELEWRVWLFGYFPGGPPLAEEFARDYLAYVGSWERPMRFDELRFDGDVWQRVAELSSIYDASDPDRRPFRDAGGKLILWQGWADPATSPLGNVAYYQAVQDTLGGLDATQRFARLYMLPGVGHCSTQPVRFDLFTPLLEWTEQGLSRVASLPPTGALVSRIARDLCSRIRPSRSSMAAEVSTTPRVSSPQRRSV